MARRNQRLDLTQHEYDTLTELVINEGNWNNVTERAGERTGRNIGPGTKYNMLENLEGRGLVQTTGIQEDSQSNFRDVKGITQKGVDTLESDVRKKEEIAAEIRQDVADYDRRRC